MDQNYGNRFRNFSIRYWLFYGFGTPIGIVFQVGLRFSRILATPWVIAPVWTFAPKQAVIPNRPSIPNEFCSLMHSVSPMGHCISIDFYSLMGLYYPINFRPQKILALYWILVSNWAVAPQWTLLACEPLIYNRPLLSKRSLLPY